MARARSGKNLAIGDREYQKRRKIEKIKAARFEAQETFRHLPKPIRRALTERFKTERAAGSTVDWNDWLKRQLEIIHGLSVQ